MSGRTMLRLALAALVSGAAAGSLLTLAFFLSGLAVGPVPGWWGVEMLVDWLQVGFLAGLVVASLPAFFAGASIWALGESFEPARHPLAWSAAGAGVGGAMWALTGLMFGNVGRDGGLDALETGLLAASLVGGAGGALAFRSTMRLTGGLGRDRRRREI